MRNRTEEMTRRINSSPATLLHSMVVPCSNQGRGMKGTLDRLIPQGRFLGVSSFKTNPKRYTVYPQSPRKSYHTILTKTLTDSGKPGFYKS